MQSIIENVHSNETLLLLWELKRNKCAQSTVFKRYFFLVIMTADFPNDNWEQPTNCTGGFKILTLSKKKYWDCFVLGPKQCTICKLPFHFC